MGRCFEGVGAFSRGWALFRVLAFSNFVSFHKVNLSLTIICSQVQQGNVNSL